MDVDTNVSTSGELTETGVLAGEFRLTELEEIVDVVVPTSGGVLVEAGEFGLTAELEMVEVVVPTSGGVLAETGVLIGEFGPRTDVERIVEVIVSVNVVDG